MKEKRIIFMGTPVFACGILQKLIDEGYNVVGVVSQPDKKVGRKQEIKMTPVKELALNHNIPVLQPIKIREDYQSILDLNPDLIVTCAYGQIVPEAVLNAPAFGCINVHASLLPRLRGGAPIHKAIIFGEEETGVSIMRMVKKMDAGAVCHVVRVAIDQDETMGSLHDKLCVAGAEALAQVLPSIFDGSAVFVEQEEEKATFAWNISKEEEKVDFTMSAQKVYDQIRGLIPFPVGYAYLNGKKVKFHQAVLSHEKCNKPSGEILGFKDGKMQVALNGGILLVGELQLEGKAKTTAADYYNGAGRSMIGKSFE